MPFYNDLSAARDARLEKFRNGLWLVCNLAAVRKREGLTQAKLAQLAGVSVATIGLLETGKNQPSARLMLILARALNTTAESLFQLHPGDVEEEVFTWMDHQWNVTTALRRYGSRTPGVLDVQATAAILAAGVVHVDAGHVDSVDLSKPLLVVPVPNGGGSLIIDGWHRVAKGLKTGKTVLPAIFLTEEESDLLRQMKKYTRKGKRA
jgi:DNA-binding XRE family transcriptional regulator